MQSEKLIINELKPQAALLFKRQKHHPAINSTILRYPHKTSTLRSNRNISALKDGTLKSAEIINFWQLQSIDNQCLFFCQNVTSFTGKKKDSETGFYYFGARYNDTVLSGIFISVDPMADKYPSLSPYAYCALNPVKLVDPEGEEMRKPEITSKGVVSYVAEKGDSKESFVRQYNVSRKATDKIFEKAGIINVSEGTRIYGETIASSVTNKTGRKYNDVLKLRWNNATDDQKVYHTLFAILCTRIKSNGDITDLNGFVDGLASSTGANSCIRINRPVSIPLTDGKTMMLQSFNSTFNKQYSTVIPDCPGQFQNRDGSWSSKQNFNQYPIGGKRGIPRILIAFPSANDDFFFKHIL